MHEIVVRFCRYRGLRWAESVDRMPVDRIPKIMIRLIAQYKRVTLWKMWIVCVEEHWRASAYYAVRRRPSPYLNWLFRDKII